MEAICRLGANTTLRGKITSLPSSSKHILTFLGVPYAQPPIGEHRFKAPKEAQLWQGERQAQEFGPICPQNIKVAARSYFPYPVPTLVDEDCLYLNVYTSKLSGKMPVMVWIHGGAFLQGFSNLYEGTALSTFHDVVTVSINYRLGPFGFLCSGDGVIEGNMGLLDQLEALRWLRKNVHNFGGDPNNITIFGESAGGISISLHLLSPLASGLFNRAICESGVSTHPNSVWTKPQAAKYVNKRLAPPGKTLSGAQILQALSEKSPEDIVNQLGDGFTPVYDGVYLPEKPLSLYQKGAFHKKDLILGFNSHEGTGFVFRLVEGTVVKTKAMARQLIERVVKVMFFRGKPNTEKIIDTVFEFYLKSVGDEDEEAITSAMVLMYGDLLFTASSLQVADFHAGSKSTYMYYFNHRPPFSTHPDFVTADHGNEIIYVFGMPFLGQYPDIWSDEDRQLSRRIMQMWTTFAANGKPECDTASWPQYRTTDKQCLSLEKDLHSITTPRTVAAHFWNETIYKLSEGSPTHSAKY